MKYDALKKHSDRRIRIRPALQRYSDAAELEATLEDIWFLTDVSPNGVRLQNEVTGHTKILGLDHIHHYMEDPDGARSGGSTGVLVLNVQLLLFNRELIVEPTVPPGEPLRSFVAVQKRMDFFSAAKDRHTKSQLALAKREFAVSPAGIKASDEAFYGILSAAETIEASLRQQGSPIEITRKSFGLLIVLGAFGWWASINWERYANTLENSRLTICKWDGHPPFPGVIPLRNPTCVTVDQYTFGLVNLDEAAWMRLGQQENYLSSEQILMGVLQDFMKNPLEPTGWFE